MSRYCYEVIGGIFVTGLTFIVLGVAGLISVAIAEAIFYQKNKWLKKEIALNEIIKKMRDQRVTERPVSEEIYENEVVKIRTQDSHTRYEEPDDSVNSDTLPISVSGDMFKVAPSVNVAENLEYSDVTFN